MKGIALRLKPAAIARKGMLLGAAAAVVGLSLLGGTAHAAGLAGASGLTLTPANGTPSSTPTYNSPACPAADQGSAVVRAVPSTSQGGPLITLAQTVSSPTAPFSGTFTYNMGFIFSNTGFTAGQTEEFVVECYPSAGLVGTPDIAFDDWVTWTDGTGDYTTSATPPAGPPTTAVSLTASPSTATAGATITLTATVTASNNTTPAGTVDFTLATSSGPVSLATGVGPNSSGAYVTTATINATGSQVITATFNPTSTTAYQGSSGTFTEDIIPAGGYAVAEPLSVTVAQSGTFTFQPVSTTAGTVTLTPGSNGTATGTANQVEVIDTRNTYPGWNVTGQAVDFTAAATSTEPAGDIPVANLGWSPNGTVVDGAQLGPAVSAPTTPVTTTGTAGGLGSASLLASAAVGTGFGTSTLGAALTLAIPASAPADTYTSTLTLTALGTPAA